MTTATATAIVGLTFVDRYDGRVGPVRPLEVTVEDDGTDDTILDAAFSTGAVTVADRVTVPSGRVWRCDPYGWSLVVDPTVLHWSIDGRTPVRAGDR